MSNNRETAFDSVEEDMQKVYPTTFNIRNIKSCRLWSYHFFSRGKAYLDIQSVDNKNYRIKEDSLARMLYGELTEPYVVYKYGRHHLEPQPKKIKLRKNEIVCGYCNGHGLISHRECPKCKGFRKVKKENT